MILTEALKTKIKQHANTDKTKEVCGVVILFKGKKKYIPCNNIHPTPEYDFYLSPSDFIKAEDMGEIIAIVHSHPITSEMPSSADIIGQAESETTWIIYSLVTDCFYEFSDGVKPSLYGRSYKHGITDCYSFVRDFYQQELNITLTNYAREDEWWHKGQNLYEDNYQEEGFRKVDFVDMRYGDLLVISLGCSVANHGAIYVGNNKVAHHASNRLSCIDVYGSFLRDRTRMVLRHKLMENKND